MAVLNRCQSLSIIIFLFPVDSLKMPPIDWKQQSPYRKEFGDPSVTGEESLPQVNATYNAKCFCGRVKYQVRGDPASSKLCHCRGCQLLHGAPFEWVSIFHKRDVRFAPESLDFLYFYSSEIDQAWEANEANERMLPVKVSCSWCRTPVADEGRNMWLAFVTVFGFTIETGIPDAFRHTNHLFYGQQCIALDDDDAVKWTGHKNQSEIYEGK